MSLETAPDRTKAVLGPGLAEPGGANITLVWELSWAALQVCGLGDRRHSRHHLPALSGRLPVWLNLDSSVQSAVQL